MNPILIIAAVVLAVVLIGMAYYIRQQRQSGATSDELKGYAVVFGFLMSLFVLIILGGAWVLWYFMTEFTASIEEPFEDYVYAAGLAIPLLAILAGVFAGRKAYK
jgi:uncharacterized membrane protein